MNKGIYNRSLLYAFMMVLFAVLGYLFFYSGFNTKTRVKVDYDNNSEVYYKVKYLDNNINIDQNKYIANMIDYIDFNYKYSNLLSEYVSGYYKYSVDSYLIAYEEDITDSLWKKKYNILSEKSYVIDQSNINSIKITDNFRIDFKKYRDEINKFINGYDIDVSGYLHIRINILEFLNFNGLENEYADNKVIVVNVPLTDDIFKINVINLNNRDSYYEFSRDVSMNIVFLIIGSFCLSLSLTFLIMVIKRFKFLYHRQSCYNKELNEILSKYADLIVRVKRFYVNKKYNMIYVDNFLELIDVSNKKNKMISFKEIKRDCESIFVILDDNDAWIYRLR